MGVKPPKGDVPQLTLDVAPHPDVLEREAQGHSTYLTGTLKIKGELPVPRDLNSGDRLLVSITDADGVVLARRYAEVEAPRFKDIRERGLGVIGTERKHTAGITDEGL